MDMPFHLFIAPYGLMFFLLVFFAKVSLSDWLALLGKGADGLKTLAIGRPFRGRGGIGCDLAQKEGGGQLSAKPTRRHFGAEREFLLANAFKSCCGVTIGAGEVRSHSNWQH